MITPSDIKFEIKDLPFGEFEVVAKLNVDAVCKTYTKYNTDIEILKNVAKRELCYKIWGERNEELTKWILKKRHEILCLNPESYNAFEKTQKFYDELLNRLNAYEIY